MEEIDRDGDCDKPGGQFKAFILYANKEVDSDRMDILFLSSLLCYCGVDSTIDQYYRNKHVLDWGKWVSDQINFCISQKGYVLLECSQSMHTSLEVTDHNQNIQMVDAHVDCLTLRHYITKHADRFIPFKIDDTSLDFVPPTLSSKSIYHFPSSQLPEDCITTVLSGQKNISDFKILDNPEFASLRSLVATLTGQQEIIQPIIGRPCSHFGDDTTLASKENVISLLSKRISQTCMQRRLVLDENRWPPEQPKDFISLQLIQYQCQKTLDQETALANLTLRGDISNVISPKQPETLQEFLNNSIITKDLATILLPFDKSHEPCFILIEGPPGIGKSFLLQEIAYRWGNKQVLKLFKLVLLVQLRDPVLQNAKSIYEIFLFYCKGDIKAAEIAAACSDYFLNNGGEGLLFLFDGFDELPEQVQKNSLIREILVRKVLPNCGLVVSTRPHVSAYLRTLAVYMVDVFGFAEAERNDYIKKTCKGQPKKIKELTTYLNQHTTINSLCFVPYNMVVLLYLYKKGIKLPENFVDLYNYFISLTICHHLAKYDYPPNAITCHDITNLPEPCNKIIKQLSKLSLEALNKQKLIFTVDEIEAACPGILDIPGAINGFGLLQAVQSFGLTKATISFNFVHYSVQEFLGAHYIAHLPQRQQLQALHKFDQNSNILFLYIALKGSKGFSGKLFLSGGNRKRAISEEFLTDQLKSIQLYHCFQEIGENEICTNIEKANVFYGQKINLRHFKLSPYHVECIALFIMSSFHKEWIELRLDGCYLQDHGIRFLHRIHGVTITSLNLDNNGFTSSSSSIISDIASECKVEWLSIAGNKTIGENSFLYRMLSSPSMLKELYMQRTDLSSNAAKHLFAALKKTETKLQVLNVMRNNINDDACDEISDAVKINTSLVTLKLQCNPLSEKSALRIVQALKKNKMLQVLGLPKYSKETERNIECIKEEVNQVRKDAKCLATLKAIKYS